MDCRREVDVDELGVEKQGVGHPELMNDDAADEQQKEVLLLSDRAKDPRRGVA